MKAIALSFFFLFSHLGKTDVGDRSTLTRGELRPIAAAALSIEAAVVTASRASPPMPPPERRPRALRAPERRAPTPKHRPCRRRVPPRRRRPRTPPPTPTASAAPDDTTLHCRPTPPAGKNVFLDLLILLVIILENEIIRKIVRK
jgi:hypothetical protein